MSKRSPDTPIVGGWTLTGVGDAKRRVKATRLEWSAPRQRRPKGATKR